VIRQFGVGKQPIQLLDAVPAGSSVINLSSQSTVWLAGNPGVAENNGFPLQPLASMEKPATGPLYAVLESGSTESAVVILVGDDLSGYSDPVALASAVATALLATGVPNVLTESVVATNALLPNGGAPQTFDVSGYASIVIVGRDNALPCTYEFQTDTGQTTDRDYFVPILAGNQLPVRLAVSSGNLVLKNVSGLADMHVDIVGTNRPALTRFDGRSRANTVQSWSGGIVAAGNDAQLAINDPLRQPHGLCFARFALSQATQTGYFFAEDVTSLATGFIVLCDAAEMMTGAANAARYLSKLVSIPAGANMWFHCTNSIGGTANIQLVQASLN